MENEWRKLMLERQKKEFEKLVFRTLLLAAPLGIVILLIYTRG